MPVAITIKLDKLSITSQLAKLEEVLDSGLILDEAAAFLLGRIRRRFLEERDPDGQGWEPSKAAIKRRLSGGTGTLYKTGRLWRSIQAAVVDGNERRVIDTDVPYARIHQLGIGQVKRVFMGFSDGDVDILERLLQLRIDQALNSARAV